MANSETSWALASPLTLFLQEAQAAGEPMQEVLLLSYTLDLAFFERTALGAAQALGARVTVVSDVGITDHDLIAIRRAGRGYINGLAHCGGAFHPKLLVLTSPERAVVVIGSGNVTLAGWHSNEELWSVLHSGDGRAPHAVPAVAEFLRRLPSRVRLSARVEPALSRVADQLAGLAAVPGTHQLVHNLDQPILDQLPTGPVDELTIYAPFYDRSGNALRALAARLQPAKLVIAVQPKLSRFDGTALADVVDANSGTIIELAEERYRHGKLIEWLSDNQRYALTGSANISTPALLSTTAAGGNCELGLISPVTESLAPTGTAVPSSGVRHITFPEEPQRSDGLLLLGAVLVAEGVEVTLIAPAPRQGRVQASAPTEPADVWETVGDLQPGVLSTVLSRLLAGGSRLRVIIDPTAVGADDGLTSNIVFVLDTARAVHRPIASGSLRPSTEPFDLFRDATLAARFVADLDSLRRDQAAVGSGAPRPPRSSASRVGGVEHDWQTYLDECAGRIGRSLLHFALGLPAFRESDDWNEHNEDDDVTDVDLTGDSAERVIEEQGESVLGAVAALPSLKDQSDYVRGRYRRWASQLADAALQREPVERLALVRLLLWVVAAGAWARDDRSWTAPLSKAVQSLGEEDLPPDARPSAGSLAAVVLAVLRDAAPRTHWTPQEGAYDAAAATSRPILVHLEQRYVQEYTSLLEPVFGTVASWEAVAAVTADLIADDPLQDAVRALEHLGRVAHVHDRLLHVPAAVGNPVSIAMQAVAQAEKAAPVGAWAGSSTNWALVLWRAPDLVVHLHNGRGFWQHFALPPVLTPSGCITTLPLQHRKANGPLVPDRARKLMTELNLDSPLPPDE